VLTKTFLRNKQTYMKYNRFRKGIFARLAPRESDVILNLLPWLLSINDPAYPGYVERLRRAIRLYGIEHDREILRKEPSFKSRFGISNEESLLKQTEDACTIQGLYTIGSSGTIGQTSHSDCDIWICIDRSDFDDTVMRQLTEKVNLIKDWLDKTLRLPVFFFICDIDDIRNCRFGSIDFESCGSAQKNVMKEEFYRTCIYIGGKIPFWWVCYDGEEKVHYDDAWRTVAANDEGNPGFVDLGNLVAVDRDEYFGAVLWQFNKSLTHPLKSIVKMFLLKMLLDSHREELLCHRFRHEVLQGKHESDPSVFAMGALMDYYGQGNPETFAFLRQCIYLRHEIKLLFRKNTLKEELVAELFHRHPVERREIYRLNNFSSWSLQEQMAFGSKIFDLLLAVYKDINALHIRGPGSIHPEDLTILGRKLSSCLAQKEHKVPLLYRAMETEHRQTLTVTLKGKTWRVTPADNPEMTITANANLITCLAYLVWNDIADVSRLRMAPNPSSVTMQEITNLCSKLREIFGINDITAVDFGNFLQDEYITKILVVVSFEQDGARKDMNDLCVIYLNSWGELFIRRFRGMETFKAFLARACHDPGRGEVHYYVQRSSLYYEKIIERTKHVVSEMLSR
jgi:adenylate cyclase, class 1